MSALAPLLSVVNVVLQMVQLLIIASVVISWFDIDPSNKFVRMIRETTEPMYAYVRKWTSRIPGPLDWAPMAILLVIMVLQSYVTRAMQ